MDVPLRLLIVEDSERDVALEVRSLEAAGYRVTCTVVDTAAGMKAALAGQASDIVISDHNLPQFDAPGALAVLKQSGQDIPFIIVSGAIGEETAVALVKAGAHDYVLKDKLAHLAPSVEHALKDAENRRGIKLAEKMLEQSEERYRALVEKAFEGIVVIQDGKIVFANPRAYEIIDYPRDITDPTPFMDFIHAEDREMVIDRHLRRLKGEQLEASYPTRLIDQNGNIKWALITAARIDWEGKPATLTFLTDIGDRKEAEERYHSLYSTMREGVAIHEIVYDMAGKPVDYVIIDANPQYESITGLNRDKVVGIRASEVYGTGAAPYLEIYCGVAQTGTPTNFETFFPPLGKHFSISVFSPGKGKFATIFSDISERKLAEEKLLKSYENLKKALDDAIKTMVKIVEMRDPYTAGHQQKVAGLATAIASEMKLEETRIEQLRTAALIHDIGKMYIPSDILSKPGKLLDIEFSLIKTHAQYGYDIVKGMDFPVAVAQAVLQHHERLDGSGYPAGIKDEDIILESKILAVADVIEAMASNRPYRPAMGVDKALEEISKNRGKLYDPGVVDACLELFKSGRFEFESV